MVRLVTKRPVLESGASSLVAGWWCPPPGYPAGRVGAPASPVNPLAGVDFARPLLPLSCSSRSPDPLLTLKVPPLLPVLGCTSLTAALRQKPLSANSLPSARTPPAAHSNDGEVHGLGPPNTASCEHPPHVSLAPQFGPEMAVLT